MAWTRPNTAAAPAAAPAPATAAQAAAAPAQHPVPPPAPMPPAAPAPVAPAAAAAPAPAPLPAPLPAPPAAPAPAAAAAPPAAAAAPAPSRRRGRAPVSDPVSVPVNAPAANPGSQVLIAAPNAVPMATPGKVTTPAVVAQAPPQAVAGVAAGSYLAQFLANAATPTASAQALTRWQDAMTSGGGEPNAFPQLTLTDSGLFDRDTMNVEGTDADLPVGRDAWYAVFLGYRLTVLAWPRAAVRGGPKTQPMWKCAVGSDNIEAMDLVAEALKAYQYTNKDRRPALFDSLCHPKAALEILWFEGRVQDGRYVGDLMITRTTPTLASCVSTTDNLMAALPRVRGADGNDYPTLAPFVARVQPSEKIPQKSKTQEWDEYAITISPLTTSDTSETQQAFAAAKAAFDQWLQSGGYTPEVDAKIKKWCETTITQEQGDILYQVSQARR